MLRVVPLCVLFFAFSLVAFGQKAKPKATPKPAPIRRVTFAEAQKMLEGEIEGNLGKQVSAERITYSLTRMINSQVLEVYYPVTANIQNSKSKVSSVPGYGILYESEAVYRGNQRPRHALEDLIPDAAGFITQTPELIARLEKRLRAKLDYTRASLKRLDSLVAANQNSAVTGDIDARLFQEMTAYYGETLRQSLTRCEWKATEERFGKNSTLTVPVLRCQAISANQLRNLRPGVSVMNALYDEKNRGASVTLAFDKDVQNAQ